MIQSAFRYSLSVAFVIALIAQSPAEQPKDKAPDPVPKAAPKKDDPFDAYRELFKKPETPQEYWKAMDFEIEVGRYDIAAMHLKGLLAKTTTDEQLLDLQRQYSMNAFLRLRNIRQWSDNPDAKARDAEDKAARADVEELIKRVTAAIQTQLKNKEQIALWIKNLNASHEEAVYALQELYNYKGAAAPLLIDALRRTKGGDKLAYIDALRRLSSDVVAPMIAALDSDDSSLVLDILDILQRRVAMQAIPYLWYLTKNPSRPDSVRKKAKEVLAALRNVPASKLPSPVAMLTQEADNYYRHKVALTDPVTIWRWDNGLAVAGWQGAETVSKSRAEEYLGMRFAKQALALNPAYKPAQIVLLSLALDKAYEKGSLDQPLAKTAPEVHDLLTTVNPDLLTAVLERALNDERTAVVLGAVRALGDVAEVKANKPTGRGEPPLVRALYYPDKRVQMATTESLLRIPGAPSAQARGRMVELMTRFLSAEPEASAKPKALAASGEVGTQLRLERAIKAAGFEPVVVQSGRDALKRLEAAADISAVLLDSKLPDPGLTSLVAQIAADPNTKKMPVLILPIADNAQTRDMLERYRKDQARLDFIISETGPIRRDRLAAKQDYEKTRKAFEDSPLPNLTEQRDRLVYLAEGYRTRLRELARAYPQQVVLDNEAQQIEATLRDLTERFDAEAERRGFTLKRWAEPYANVQVVSQSFLDDTRQLQARLSGENQADLKPLSEAEQKDYAEKAIRALAQMAKGDAAAYDVQPAEKAIYAALRSGQISAEGQIAAVETIGRFPGPNPQTELALLVGDGKRALPVRIHATDELIRHIQQHSLLLTRDQIKNLRTQTDMTAGQADQKDLRLHLTALLGALRPDDRATGDLLRGFEPRSPPPPPRPPPPDK